MRSKRRASERTPSEIAAAASFVARVQDGFSARRTPWSRGTALWHDLYRRIWDLNFLRLERCEGAEAASLAREADEVQGAAGLRHRKIMVHDQACGRSLARGFEKLGWRTQRLVVMVHNGTHDGAGRAPVEETPVARLRPTLEQYFRTAPFIDDEETYTQIVEQYSLEPAGIRERCFAAPLDGLYPSFCLLFTDGKTAQVEDVTTLEDYRNRGLASAVVLTAVDVARSEGHELVFLIADADDWPKDWYRKLGFEERGFFYEFIRG